MSITATHPFTNSVVILIFGWYVLLYIMYPKAAVATVFEIATFPLAKILHSGSIENVFSVFENFAPIFFLNAKNDHFVFLAIICHLIDLQT